MNWTRVVSSALLTIGGLVLIVAGVTGLVHGSPSLPLSVGALVLGFVATGLGIRIFRGRHA